jgi:hypothetical protein
VGFRHICSFTILELLVLPLCSSQWFLLWNAAQVQLPDKTNEQQRASPQAWCRLFWEDDNARYSADYMTVPTIWGWGAGVGGQHLMCVLNWWTDFLWRGNSTLFLWRLVGTFIVNNNYIICVYVHISLELYDVLLNYKVSGDFVCVLQNVIAEVILSQKYHKNVGPILNGSFRYSITCWLKCGVPRYTGSTSVIVLCVVQIVLISIHSCQLRGSHFCPHSERVVHP